MALWLVRAGKDGEREDIAFKYGYVVLGWEELGPLDWVTNRSELQNLLRKHKPDAQDRAIQNWSGQIWAFLSQISEGDFVVTPLKSRPIVKVGRVIGGYEYVTLEGSPAHVRPVEWLNEIPKDSLDSDIRQSLSALMAVCRIDRQNAQHRIETLVANGLPLPLSVAEGAPKADVPDLEDVALQRVHEFVSQKFRGHRLADLVAAVLSAKGYAVRVAPPGPDGGVDILAGSGAFGFEAPRIAVQVKSSDSPVGIGAIRELQGVMRNFGATHGLFVSWGGFKRSVITEAPRLFFEIRLWNARNLLQELFRHYENLSDEVQAEIPLKRVWVLVDPG